MDKNGNVTDMEILQAGDGVLVPGQMQSSVQIQPIRGQPFKQNKLDGSMVVVNYENDHEDEKHNCCVRYFCCNIYNPKHDLGICCLFLAVITIIIAVTAGLCDRI
jgi:hypothetical protein